jgi:hypothetical protein
MARMMRQVALALAVLALVAGATGQARAGLVYVGSWEVDQGPSWTSHPSIYTGQDAAALLFGGSPSDYSISTIDSNPADVNFMAWYSPWGGSSPGYTAQPNGDRNSPAGVLASQSAFVDYGGTGLYDTSGDLSAYVADWAQGSFYTNFAFVNTASVPEPSTLTGASIAVFLSLACVWRRLKAKRAA